MASINSTEMDSVSGRRNEDFKKLTQHTYENIIAKSRDLFLDKPPWLGTL